MRVWSPEDHHLHVLVVRLLDGDGVLDVIRSYVGLRTIDLRDGWQQLNGQPLYLKMALDQGYCPSGLLASPSDEALAAEVEWARRFGFNGARKHQKIDDPR